MFREFIVENGNDDEKAPILTCNDGALMRIARRRVTFKAGARRLVRICRLLFDTGPWPNKDVGQTVRDLVLVRNIIVHAGGWPNNEHATRIGTPGVIVRANQLFWELQLDDFLGAGLWVFEQDPKFRFTGF